MRAGDVERVMGAVERLLTGQAPADLPGPLLLEAFVRRGDGAAFAELVRRHGPTVLRVCRSLLPPDDAEDAFQATFLVLACGAAKVRRSASLAAFLHGVARRVALKARAREGRRRAAEAAAARERAETADRERGAEAELHEELARLPERHRQVLVLCHLEGRTHEQAARELGWPVGSVSRRLRRAAEALRERLAGRGVPAAVGAAAAVPAALAGATVRAAEQAARAGQVGGTGAAATLAREVLRAMSATRLGGVAALALLVGVVAGAAVFAGGEAPAGKERPAAAARPPLPERAGPPLDRQGDPLPPGALARLGTARLRHGGPVLSLAFSPDGLTLATLGHDRALRLWRAADGRAWGALGRRQGYHNTVAFSADGRAVATVAEDGSIALAGFLPATKEGQPPQIGAERLSLKHDPGSASFLAFRPDGKLVSGTAQGEARLWDAATGGELARFGVARSEVPHAFALSPDGAVLALAGRTDDVPLWDVNTGKQVGSLPGHLKARSLAFSPDGGTLAVGDEANSIRLWDLKARRVTAKLVGVKAPHQVGGIGDAVFALAFSPDGKTLASLGDLADGTLRIWDVPTGKERLRLQGEHGDSARLAFAPDGKTLAVAGENNTVRLWDAATGRPLDVGLGSQGSVHAVAVSPDGAVAALAGSDGVVRLWDRATGREVRSFRAHRQQVTSLAFTSDGRRLLSSGAYDAARLWDVRSGQEVRSFDGAQGNVRGVAWLAVAPDGKRLALATYTPAVQLVETATGRVERTVAQGALVDQVAFAPDGRTLAGGGFDQTLHLWDAATGEEKWSRRAGGSVGAVAFAADGRLVAAGTYTNQIILWAAATGQEERRFDGPGGVVRSLALSPDGTLIAVGGDSDVVTLYETATGQPVRRLSGHVGFVWSLAFAPDGRSLVTGSFDATALVWDLTGRDLAQKPLTDAELEGRWAALGGDAAAAHQALLALANAPGSAAFLRGRLGAAAPDPKAVARWLAELDDDEFEVREKASAALASLGKAVEDDLRRARPTAPSVESRARIDRLLAALGEGAAVDEGLRARRAVAALELAATAEARSALGHLAEKASAEDTRRLAAEALRRLAKRP
jgi:RNA polymerase sigma factor (sigma-70 family)